MRAAALLFACRLASGHFQLTWPPSRARGGMQTAGTCNGANPFEPYEEGTCFWFSQCCTPGQPACTGQYRLPGSGAPVPVWCGDEALRLEPALNDPRLRTWRDFDGVDATRYNPWRNPGWAPVLSACGAAGGWTGATEVLQPRGVRPGSDGVDLPPLDGAPPRWAAGSAAEVAFSIYVNHGGGYAYRLCPADREPTEACFREHHLEPVGNVSWVQRGADPSSRVEIVATRVSSLPGDRQPAGGTWTKNPVPPCDGPDGGDYMSACEKPMWEPPAPDLWGIGLGRCFPSNGTAPAGSGGTRCTAAEERFWSARFNFNIVDRVAVPDHLRPGNYTLSWRLDAEQTPQVWTNCADVVIT
mmetsp:Transcript_25491/g.78553  ORF Transcript_25491/g.78553 Transcript_25491/m.78553 type:complete len:356 (-) Transcript_25491:17-1084(-)